MTSSVFFCISYFVRKHPGSHFLLQGRRVHHLSKNMQLNAFRNSCHKTAGTATKIIFGLSIPITHALSTTQRCILKITTDWKHIALQLSEPPS